MLALQEAKERLVELALRAEASREYRDAQANRDEAVRRTRDMTKPWRMSSQGSGLKAASSSDAASDAQADRDNLGVAYGCAYASKSLYAHGICRPQW